MFVSEGFEKGKSQLRRHRFWGQHKWYLRRPTRGLTKGPSSHPSWNISTSPKLGRMVFSNSTVCIQGERDSSWYSRYASFLDVASSLKGLFKTRGVPKWMFRTTGTPMEQAKVPSNTTHPFEATLRDWFKHCEASGPQSIHSQIRLCLEMLIM